LWSWATDPGFKSSPSGNYTIPRLFRSISIFWPTHSGGGAACSSCTSKQCNPLACIATPSVAAAAASPTPKFFNSPPPVLRRVPTSLKFLNSHRRPSPPAVASRLYPVSASASGGFSLPGIAPVMIATTSPMVCFCGVVSATRRPRRMI